MFGSTELRNGPDLRLHWNGYVVSTAFPQLLFSGITFRQTDSQRFSLVFNETSTVINLRDRMLAAYEGDTSLSTIVQRMCTDAECWNVVTTAVTHIMLEPWKLSDRNLENS